jgi:hypothetical protein
MLQSKMSGHNARACRGRVTFSKKAAGARKERLACIVCRSRSTMPIMPLTHGKTRARHSIAKKSR